MEQEKQEVEQREREIERRTREVELRTKEVKLRKKEVELRTKEAEQKMKEAKEGPTKIARKLLATGMSVDQVVEMTELSKHEVAQMKKKRNRD